MSSPKLNVQPKIIVLDDDPTGSQTVHSCLLLTQWDLETLKRGLLDTSPIFFILTNTRALAPTQAAQVTQEVCRALKGAIATTPIQSYLVVSRSDSTLRGHYPLETDVIATELGPFDAHFLVPAFFEGGRITRDSVHYLDSGGILTPVHATEFAQDAVFRYHSSYLPDYVAEKTQGRIPPDQVRRFLLPMIRAGCVDRLLSLHHNVCGVVDGETQADLDQFATDILAATAQGKRFLFRSAASFLTALAQLPPQPISPQQMGQTTQGRQPGAIHPGAIIVGSYVQKTTQQLQRLLQEPGVAPIEVDVTALQTHNPAQSNHQSNHQSNQLLTIIQTSIHTAFSHNQTPVIYTSRTVLTLGNDHLQLQLSRRISDLLVQIVQGLPPELSFLISKGGITSNSILTLGLALPTVRLLGQVLPGVSVVQTPEDHDHFPKLPVVLFPGNVGDENALVLAYRCLQP
jgi:uncharacterized protein YgbK (DUF1537 family)